MKRLFTAHASRRWPLVSVGLFAILVVALVAITDSGEPVNTSHPFGSASFSVFDQGRTGLPKSLERRLPPAPRSIRWSEAHRLVGIGPKVWAFLGEDELCLLGQEGAASITVVCTGRRRALEHGIFIASVRDSSMSDSGPVREVIGLAPDSAGVVHLITPGSKSVTVPVDHNVFIWRDDVPASPLTAVLARR